MSFLVSVVVTVVAMVLVGIFAGTETGFLSLDVNNLIQRTKAPGMTSEKLLLDIVRAPERFLAMTLLGINMSMVVATSMFSELLHDLDPIMVSTATVLFSGVIFVTCELLPKMAFGSRPLAMLLRFLGPIKFFDHLLVIPVRVVNRITHKVMEFLKLGGDRKKRTISREELLILLSAGASSGVLRDRPHRMARGIIGLKERDIREIMKPRTSMVTLDATVSLSHARKVFSETGYSRIPVFEGTIDHVIGFIYFKDLFLKGSDTRPLRDLLSPVVVVPEMSSAFDVFHKMRERNFQAAIVLDEYGSTSGLITLEDLIEEVVGEIEDELDESPAELKFNADGTITARTEVNLSTFCEQTGSTLTGTNGINTLNGLILSRLGRIPLVGEGLLLDGLRVEILQADPKRTILVKVNMTDAAERPSAS